MQVIRVPSSEIGTAPSHGDDLALSQDTFSLTGQHVVVTGGGRGLGRAIALSAAAAGAMVTVVARTEDEVNETVDLGRQQRGGECIARPADLSDTGEMPGLVESIADRQPIDGVVHAAGTQIRKAAIDITADDWDAVQAVNLRAPFFLSAAIANHQLAEGRGGSHIFVGSLNSSIGLANMVPYVASKTALVGVARALSTEWSPVGIRANVIGPGYFHTALTDELLSRPVERTRILNRIPMGVLGTPSDLGGVCVFLLSDASRYLTGQLINVDGGWLSS